MEREEGRGRRKRPSLISKDSHGHSWLRYSLGSRVFSYAASYIPFSQWGHLVINPTTQSVPLWSAVFHLYQLQPNATSGPYWQQKDGEIYYTLKPVICQRASGQRHMIYIYIARLSSISEPYEAYYTCALIMGTPDELTTCGASYHCHRRNRIWVLIVKRFFIEIRVTTELWGDEVVTRSQLERDGSIKGAKCKNF